MKIHRIVSGLLASNMYLLEERGPVIAVDPCEDLSACDPALTYDRIFLTHEHCDHISGVDARREGTGARVICSLPCGENLKDGKKKLPPETTVYPGHFEPRVLAEFNRVLLN